MLLVFEKLYRQERKIFNMLATKIKKSKKVVRTLKGVHDVVEDYALDDILIHFDREANVLKVTENTSKPNPDHNYYLSCRYASGSENEDELQRARHDMFMWLLNIARQTYEKKLDKPKLFAKASKVLSMLFPDDYVNSVKKQNVERNAQAADWLKNQKKKQRA
jgi:hypothetical protein